MTKRHKHGSASNNPTSIDPHKLYIIFHKPKSLVGYLISAWTLGKYSHSEFLYDGIVYYTNPGGVTSKEWIHQDNFDYYEVNAGINPYRVIEYYNLTKGTPYDWSGVLQQVFWNTKIEDDDKYFCSEWCLRALNYALYGTPESSFINGVKDPSKFNPVRLHKYLIKAGTIKPDKVAI